MDPLTLAAKRFLEEHETAWSPPPGKEAPEFLRLEVPSAHRGDALKTLRLLEWQPENRHPISIVEVPFDDGAKYERLVAAEVDKDVELVVAGLQEDGVVLAPAPPVAAETRLAHRWLAQGRRLAGPLGGLNVVLAPKTISDPKAFVRWLTELEKPKPESPLRLDVLACDCEGLREAVRDEARFDVNEEELFRYLRDLGGKSSAGPSTDPPKLTEEQRKQIEAELGQPILSVHAGQTLKRFLMDGGKALGEGRAKEAVRKFRAARALAEGTGLKDQVLLTTMALGTAYAALQNYRGATASYERARRLASAQNLDAIEAQALFGLGFVHMMEKRFRDAAAVYQVLADSAPADSPMKREALRMVEAAKRGDPSYGLEGVAS